MVSERGEQNSAIEVGHESLSDMQQRMGLSDMMRLLTVMIAVSVS